MRHRKASYKLGRTTAHRLATLRNLACSLFEHGQIVTTLPRAKAVQPFVEKIVTLAKRGDLHARRMVIAKLGWDRPAFHWLFAPKGDDAAKDIAQKQADAAQAFFDIPAADAVEVNRYGEFRKAPRLVKHIFTNVAPRFSDRPGGYTRIVKLGKHRIGDGGEQVVLQFVGAEEGPEIGGNLSTRRRIADKRTAFAKTAKDKYAKAAAST
ncbi:MAG: 50S ribosomal protein L17 [Phycisphaerales bacterium]|nr:50S ribosomal protein L17 [Phycisphaerales bacterium]